MKLNAKSLYGLLALIDLSVTYPGNAAQTKEIAERQNIPVKYLEQVLSQLRRGGLVTSLRGAQGGYQLAKPPRQISLKEALAVLDDTGYFQGEAEREVHASANDINTIQETLRDIQHCLDEKLASYSMMDLVQRKLQKERISVYQI